LNCFRTLIVIFVILEIYENFTAIFEQAEGGYIAYIEEIPGVNTQGDTLDEARSNLLEAFEMVISVRREIADKIIVSAHP
jgi:predicted RNase H-like HicB family nuclease